MYKLRLLQKALSTLMYYGTLYFKIIGILLRKKIRAKVIKALIEERGHKCIYLPPYSPFLNPIEEFWSKVKAGVRRVPSTADGRLIDRICESTGKVTKKDCKG